MAMAEFWKATRILLFGEELATPPASPAQKQANRAGQPEQGIVKVIASADNDTVTVTYDFQSPQSETQREG